jgi:hypothetical protein
MTQRIIYPTDDGRVAILIPANCGLTIEEIAAKDVPEGKPFKIVDVTDIPSDREFRDAWEADMSNADGYGIGAEAWFLEQEAKNNEVSE